MTMTIKSQNMSKYQNANRLAHNVPAGLVLSLTRYRADMFRYTGRHLTLERVGTNFQILCVLRGHNALVISSMTCFYHQTSITHIFSIYICIYNIICIHTLQLDTLRFWCWMLGHGPGNKWHHEINGKVKLEETGQTLSLSLTGTLVRSK